MGRMRLAVSILSDLNPNRSTKKAGQIHSAAT